MMQFKHIGARIGVVIFTFVACLELAGLLPWAYALRHHAQQAAASAIDRGEGLFVSLVQQQTQIHKLTAQALSAEPAFTTAVASSDSAAIRTLLINSQARLHADFVYYFNAQDGMRIHSQHEVVPDRLTAELHPWIQQYRSGAIQFVNLTGQPYQLIMIPVKQAAADSWLVLGYKLNQAYRPLVSHLGKLDVSYIYKAKGQQWRLAGSTLPAVQSNLLVNAIANTYQKKLSLQHLQLSDDAVDLKIRTLHEDADNTILLVLQRSESQAIRDLQTMYQHMLYVALAGLVFLAFILRRLSQRTVQPIHQLLEAVNKVTEGQYHQPVKLNRVDELGALGAGIQAMIASLLARKEEIRTLAFQDALTGLANRLALIERLQSAIAEAGAKGGHCSVLIFNLDRFKTVNTTLGRAHGDALLKHVGEVLRDHLPGQADMVARLGGDEFAVLLTHSDQQQASLYADKVSRIFDRPVEIMQQTLDVRMGMGIATYPQHGQNDEVLLDHAETAQQTSKQNQNGWVVYHQNLEHDHVTTLNMISELQRAVAEDHFLLYLQPKVDMHTRQVLGGEALIRWVHPEKGMIFPDHFIPFSEQTGVIAQITEWVLNKACSVIAELQQQGVPITLAVNLSARDLNRCDLPDIMKGLLQRHQIQSQSIKLEITESTSMQNPECSQLVLEQLAEIGLQIAIDDFGTGYSSLSCLRQLPVHELKIDKSFVMFMDKNPDDLAIVKSTIDLAHNLGLRVVAEGIESEALFNQLDALGCDEGQGYYIGKPMPVHDFVIWMERWTGQQVAALDLGQQTGSVADTPISHLDFDLNAAPSQTTNVPASDAQSNR